MSNITFKIVGLLFFLSVGSCGGESMPSQEDPIDIGANIYERSRNEWLNLKAQNGDSYKYTVETASWTGTGSSTEIVVDEGEVISRSYQEYVRSDETGELTVTDTFEETGADIGKDERGAPALTMDELYELCISEYIVVDDEENEIHFETFDDGIVSLCGYVPKGCVDDCYQGFTISEFKWM